MKQLQLIGKRFGKLTVQERVEETLKGNSVWRCVCDCGNYKLFKARDLVHDNIKSCGCLLKWKAKEYIKRKYYHIWYYMIDRCVNPKNKSYRNYGAKGVSVCDIWRNDYWSFHKWMEDNNWVQGLQIDRYPDKKGNYSPENCRLATSKMQQNNRNNNTPITFMGATKNMSEWAQEFNIRPSSLGNRLKRGWDIESALLTPNKKGLGFLKRERNKKGQFK